MTSVAEKSSRRTRRRTTPYALTHIAEEHRMLAWHMQRLIGLARAYPCVGQYRALDVEQSALLAKVADRLDIVYAQLCEVLTPAMAATIAAEQAELNADMARYDQQMRKGGQHASTL